MRSIVFRIVATGFVAAGGAGCATAAASVPVEARLELARPPTRTLGPDRAFAPTPERSDAGWELASSRGVQSFDPSVQAEVSSSEARCPEEMVLVDGRVCVDRWEGVIVESDGGEERLWSPYEPLDGEDDGYRAVSRPGVVPQGYISGEQAANACQASGKRLCRVDEWERACRGPSHQAFPYGNARESGTCNDDVRAVHPVVEASNHAGLPEESYWREGMNLPEINQLPDSLATTGERNQCVSPEGVYDMVGNLHEWIDDPDGTFRGGFYMDTSHNGEGCSYATTAHDFRYHDYSTGFRCCMDPYDVE